MSSFRNAAKSYQKVHQERSQLHSREHFGKLEKKKDYKKRSEEHHKRENALKLLRKKANDRNPDEFYFHMINSKIIDGEHHSFDKSTPSTQEQLLLMQDRRYIRFKRDIEFKKIQKLKSELHLLDQDKATNNHYLFFDSKQEVLDFDSATYFDTDKNLVDRPFNRIKNTTLHQLDLQHGLDDKQLSIQALEKKKMYDQLSKRIKREKQLRVIEEKISINKIDLKSKKKNIIPESQDHAPVYKWTYQRKR